MSRAPWDLTALLNAADPRAPRPDRNLWLIRLMEWLRHGEAVVVPETGATPRPVLRLKHLLNVLERHAEPRARVVAMLSRLWTQGDVAALFADLGFTARRDLWGEVGERLALRLLPGTPDTDDLAALAQLLFTDAGDAAWLLAIDDATLARLAALLSAARGHALSPGADASAGPPPLADWRAPLLQAMTWLVSAVRAAGFAPLLRQRMDAALVADKPFEQLARVTEALADAIAAGDATATAQQASYLRALLARCRAAADSVNAHLEAYGVSVNIVFELQQLHDRTLRLEALLDVVLSDAPQRPLLLLVAELVRLSRERRSLRSLIGQQYALLARKVAERHAETGEHYITRNRDEYRAMLRHAAGGGTVIAGTTFAKFGIVALGLAPFWAGLGAGLNYAISFLIIHLLHWTVATKQPAMTAPAMADKLAGIRGRGDSGPQDAAAVEGFVDEVAHLVRSQIAGIAGNLALVIPVVLALQGLAWWALGRPLIDEKSARYVLHSITLLGPTPLYAAFTGVLLFASSLIAGWAENWFVYHRLDSALAHHPAAIARLGAPRAARWSAWWRANISGLAANLSLGLLLGVVPAVLGFIGLPLDVRHVTLSTGQLAAAVGTLGWGTLQTAGFWWCVASLAVIGVLNLGVSFWLALKVAMRSRGITVADRRRLYRAIGSRLRRAPRSFLLPD
jgi:site-specific recombinase